MGCQMRGGGEADSAEEGSGALQAQAGIAANLHAPADVNVA